MAQQYNNMAFNFCLSGGSKERAQSVSGWRMDHHPGEQSTWGQRCSHLSRSASRPDSHQPQDCPGSGSHGSHGIHRRRRLADASPGGQQWRYQQSPGCHPRQQTQLTNCQQTAITCWHLLEHVHWTFVTLAW